MAHVFTPDDGSLRELFYDVVNSVPTLSHLSSPLLRVAFQWSDEQKVKDNKLVFADTEKIKDKLKGFLAYDFLITFYEPNLRDVSEEGKRRLMYHECLHIGFDGDNKFWIIPHDFEDFKEIVRKYGADWINCD